MKPISFYALATRLLQKEQCPEGFRSAVSRAYYAAFHSAKEFVEGMGLHLLKGSDQHGDVRNHLANTGDADIDQVGFDLATLHGERINADYRLQRLNVESKQTADNLVNQAGDIIAAINKCLASPARHASVTSEVKKQSKRLRGLTP